MMIFGSSIASPFFPAFTWSDDLVKSNLQLAECTGNCKNLNKVAVIVGHLDGVEELTTCTDHGVCLHDDIPELTCLDALPFLLGGYIIGNDDNRDSCRCELFAGTGWSWKNPVGETTIQKSGLYAFKLELHGQHPPVQVSYRWWP